MTKKVGLFLFIGVFFVACATRNKQPYRNKTKLKPGQPIPCPHKDC
jgi:hypothetical protein